MTQTPPPTTHPTDASGTLSALSARLRHEAARMDDEVAATLGLLALTRRRADNLRRDADILDDVWKAMM